MSLYLKKIAEPEGFAQWREDFEGKHRELLNLHPIWDRENGEKVPGALSFKGLQYFILRACFDAFLHKDPERKCHSNAVFEITNQGRNPIKAIEELKYFCKQNPEAAEIIAGYWFPGIFGSRPNLPARLDKKKPVEMLQLSLEKLKDSIELYAEKASTEGFASNHHGSLSFPRKKEPKKKGRPSTGSTDPAQDGLIFELAMLIHCYLTRTSNADIMEIPQKSRLKEGDEIIAQLVNATLTKNMTAKEIHDRLDYLKKAGVRWVDWEHYYHAPKPNQAATKPGEELPHITPRLFEK